MISVNYPAGWMLFVFFDVVSHNDPVVSHFEFVEQLEMFIERMNIDNDTPICLLGTMLGGYLAQYFAQKAPKRVTALILSNSFCSTKYFEKNPPLGGFASLLPEFVLKLSKYN